MTPAWTLRQEELLRDCIVSPDVFNSIVDRLCAFVMPYNTRLRPRPASAMSTSTFRAVVHLPRKNAEMIAALVDVERLVLQRSSAPPPGIITWQGFDS